MQNPVNVLNIKGLWHIVKIKYSIKEKKTSLTFEKE